MTSRKAREQEAVDAIASALGIKEESYSEVNVHIRVPKGLRLGQAIVNALGHLHKVNPSITEEPSTALYYITNEELQSAIYRFHKPYGFGNQ